MGLGIFIAVVGLILAVGSALINSMMPVVYWVPVLLMCFYSGLVIFGAGLGILVGSFLWT